MTPVNPLPWAARASFIPFPRPVPVPAALPTDAPLLSLCVNEEWWTYLIGALKALARPETWIGTQAEIDATCQNAMALLGLLEDSCVSQIQFRNPSACTLEVSLDAGATWMQIYDGAACIAAKIADGTIPGSSKVAVSPPIYTSCVDYFPVIPAWSSWDLPVLVNAGDTITVTQHPTGQVWSDDILIFTLYCPDGTFFAQITGCGAGDPAHAGDPLMTANHMELLVNIAGTYYRPMLGPITVPAGVTNEVARFLPNDSQFADNFGTITFKVEHCAAGWVHTFDFTASNGGWAIRDDAFGQYVAGVGWESLNDALHVQSPPLSHAVVVTGLEFHFRAIVPTIGPAGNQIFQIVALGGSNLLANVPPPSPYWAGTATVLVQTLNQAFAINDILYSHNFGVIGSGAILALTKVIVVGQGTDPF